MKQGLFASKKMSLVDHVLDHILNYLLDHMLDHMIMGFVIMALYRNCYLNQKFYKYIIFWLLIVGVPGAKLFWGFGI